LRGNDPTAPLAQLLGCRVKIRRARSCLDDAATDPLIEKPLPQASRLVRYNFD
jgi:hypothetical protein